MGSGETLGASEVALGSVHLALQNLLSVLIGILGLAFLARTITQEEMGTLAAITLVVSFIHLVSDLGLSSSLAKFVSELKGRGEDFSTHFISSLIFKVPASLLLCSTLFIFSANVSLALFGSLSCYELIRLAASDAFLSGLSSPFSGLLLGSGRLRRMAICGISSAAVRWLAIVLLVWGRYGLCGVVMGWIIGDLFLLLLYSTSSIKLIIFKKGLIRKGSILVPRLLKFSGPLFAASIVSFLYGWYDKALVLAFLPLTDLGVYDISYKAFGVLASIASALGSSLFPYYGMAYGRKDHGAIASAIKRASRYTMMIMFPLTIGLLSTAKPVITLFAGQQYEPGWTVLAILSVFGLVYGFLPAFIDLPLIYEKTRMVLLLSFISVISSLALLPLLWIIGLNGLAVMRGASLLSSLLVTGYFLSKIVKIEIDKQAFMKTLGSSTVMAVAVSAAQQLYYSKFLLPAYVLIGAAAYVTGIKLLRVPNRTDIHLLKPILGERTASYIIRILE